MTPQQYEWVKQRGSKPVTISVADFNDQSDRTLLFGYLVDRETFHVYLKDGMIHRLIYLYDNTSVSHSSDVIFKAEDLRPDKRAYPARTDYEFALLMAEKGIDISYTTFQEVPYQQFYGKIAIE